MRSAANIFELNFFPVFSHKFLSFIYNGSLVFSCVCVCILRFYDKKLNKEKLQQSNRGGMRKIFVTRQFFEASCPQGHFFEKNPFLD